MRFRRATAVAPSSVMVSTMHAGESPTDVELVRSLLAAQFPDWADLRIEAVVPAGTVNTVYRLGDDMCVRLPRMASGPLDRELRWLPKLAPVLPLTIPVPLVAGEPTDAFPFRWAVFRWVDGEMASAETIADPRQMTRDLAAFIAALQRVDATGGPAPRGDNAFRGAHLAELDKYVQPAIASLDGAIDSHAVSSEWETALSTAVWERKPVWIHGDLDLRNMLVKQGRLTAVLDFGCLGVGDPACDVTVAWKALPEDCRKLFRDTLDVDRATWARARGWALSQAVLVLAYYTIETNAALVREARRWLAAVLSDDAAS